jgi:filamentous hemagglutinin family protein
MNELFSRLWQAGSIAALCLLTSSLAQAQSISSDGTLPNPTEVNSTTKGFEINGGTTRGSNLFHSFKDFSVPTGLEAFFNNNSSIVNILNRVTGGNLSSIDGLIRANGSANLFLINPAGIIFGENARLSIGGSFYGSTADSLLFDDGTEFSATDTQTQPILTINAPIGLNLRDNPEEIVNRSFVQNSAGEFVGLEVLPGKNLTLVGGNINFEAGEATAKGGNIELGGLSEAGTVGINDDGSLNFPEDVALSDITFSNGADVDVRGTGGGNITVNARNLNLEAGEFGSSFLRAGITADSTLSDAQAGDIIVNVTDNLTLDDSRITNQVDSGGVGNSGNITIVTSSVSLTEEAEISTEAFQDGNAGNITIDVIDNVSLDGGSNIDSSSGFGQSSSGGVNITTTTGSLFLTNGAFIRSSTFGVGDAGVISIKTDGEVNISDANIFNNVERGGVGDSLGINIEAGSLSLKDGAQIQTLVRGVTDDNPNFGQGNAGEILIDVEGDITLSGIDNNGFSSKLVSDLGTGAQGSAGNITVSARSLSLTEEAEISTEAFQDGNAGNITIDVIDTVSLDGGSQIDSSSGFGQSSSGGVNITTGSLFLTKGAFIRSSTFGLGNAGLIEINASGTVAIDGEDSDGFQSGIFSAVVEGAVGDAGGIDITTANLNLTNGGDISATTFGQGDAGTVNITANNLSLTDGARIEVASEGEGEGGDLFVEADSLTLENSSLSASTPVGTGGNITLQIDDNLILRDNSTISAQAFQDADGGNIDIDADFVIAFPSSGDGNDIIASAAGVGKGGNITITTNSIFNMREGKAISGNGTNDLDASSEFGLDGNITINTPDADPFQETRETPENVVETDAVVAGTCDPVQAGRDILAGTENTFVIKGRGGVPPEPTEPLTADVLNIEGEALVEQLQNRSSAGEENPLVNPHQQPQGILTSQGYIIPARGIVKTEDGEIFWVGYPVDSSNQRIPNGSAHCTPE